MSIHRIADAVAATQPVGRLLLLVAFTCCVQCCVLHATCSQHACSMLPPCFTSAAVRCGAHFTHGQSRSAMCSAAQRLSYRILSFLLGAAARCRQRVHSHGSRSQHRRAGQVRIQRCNKCTESNGAPNPTVQPVALRCSVAVSPAQPSPAQPSPAQPSPAQPSPSHPSADAFGSLRQGRRLLLAPLECSLSTP